MVGDAADIDVQELEWDEWNTEHLKKHGVTRDDVVAVLLNAPRYFANLPDRAGTHVMLGPNQDGAFFFVVLRPTARGARWRPVTAWRMNRRKALTLYDSSGGSHGDR